MNTYKTIYFLVIDDTVVTYSNDKDDCLKALCGIPFKIQCIPNMLSSLSDEEIMRERYMVSDSRVSIFMLPTYREKDVPMSICILDINYIWDKWNDPVGQTVATYLSTHPDLVDLNQCYRYEQAFFNACWKLADYDKKGCYDLMDASDMWKECIMKEVDGDDK